jgi:fructokinase
MRNIRIGIDIGGTKIEIVAIDESSRIVYRKRQQAPHDNYDQTLFVIEELVTGVEQKLGRAASIGVGMPGIISPVTGVVKNSNSVHLIGHPLDKDLSKLLDRPLRFANDANCLALSESTDGAAENADSVFAVILGTGVGGGLVINRKVVNGINAITGEWGHNPLPWPKTDEWPGPKCYCGKTGCIETFLSGSGLARIHTSKSGQTFSALEIANLSEQGDIVAEASLSQYEERLARALASVINVIDPEIIVLGGGLSNLDRITANVPPLWEPFVFSDHVKTQLVRAQHGDSSGVRGAAWLWNS